MTASHHPLPLTRPLRGLRLGGTLPASCDEALLAQRERAGFERGRTEGQRELNDQLMRQRTELLELQNGVLESLRQALPQVLRDCEQALTALALEVAQKLVAGLPISGEMVESAVREALEQVEETAAYHIYLPPDYETAKDRRYPVVYWLHGRGGSGTVTNTCTAPEVRHA